MRTRPRLFAFGLRGRIVATVLLCTVATLSVAAIALLGPLEHSLQNAALKTLKSDVANRHVAEPFENLPLQHASLVDADVDADAPAAVQALERQGATERRRLYALQARINYQIGATATVQTNVDAAGASYTVPASENGEQVTGSAISGDDSGSYDDVAKAAETRTNVYSVGSLNGHEIVRAAIPLKNGTVLALRKQIDEIPGAVAAVRHAFFYAGLAGLALSLLLGVSLAARLVRRLQRLRVSALKIADGGQSAEVPKDRVRDEVGDLGRSFAVMQRRLQHQEEARRAFVATASHELRTPLTSLEGMLELLDDDLRDETPDIADARELLASARAQSRRLGRLAADLLDLSRIDADVQLRSEPIELGELCRAVLAEFTLGTRARGIEAGLQETSASIWALGDPGSVARILRILLDNAVRVSPEGSEVTVELGADPLPSMSVRDRGPGVEEGEREVIFERFHRGRATGGAAGFGLGLAIGRELAERMGGTLVLAQADGPGARFTLTLPAAEATEEDPVLIA